jgi:hypothetical protein
VKNSFCVVSERVHKFHLRSLFIVTQQEGEYYKRAWQVTDASCPAAQRALGMQARLDERCGDAIEHYHLAVRSASECSCDVPLSFFVLLFR